MDIEMNTVYIIPVGTIKEDILTRIVPCLEERFLFRFRVSDPIVVPEQAYSATKRKYLSSTICEKIGHSAPFDAKYALGITDVDIFEDSANLIYNFTNKEESVGLISIHRFHSAGGRALQCEDIFFQRLLKEATHELGHLMGFRHCFNNSCVMYFSYSINDTDKKEAFFCRECEKKLNMKQNS